MTRSLFPVVIAFMLRGVMGCTVNNGDDADPCHDNDGDGLTVCAGDCDDSNAARHEGAEEICDGLDTDCDDLIPFAESPRFENHNVMVDTDADDFSTCAGDCDDRNRWIHPGADELCNGLDDDCDGEADEDFIDFDPNVNVDVDFDGFTRCNGDCDENYDFVNKDSLIIWEFNQTLVADYLPEWVYTDDVWFFPSADNYLTRACQPLYSDWPWNPADLNFALEWLEPPYESRCNEVITGYQAAIAAGVLYAQLFDPTYDAVWDQKFMDRHDLSMVVSGYYDLDAEWCEIWFDYEVVEPE